MIPANSISIHRVTVKNILAMTDFSPTSASVLPYAANWARRFGATVHIAHFIRPTSYAMAGDAYGLLIENLWKMGRENLAALEASDVLREVPHTTFLDSGEILDGLATLMKARNVDLIVMGTGSRRGLGKALIGSTAEAVFRTVMCPVLMLGPNLSPAAEEPREPRRILFATDFGPAADRAAAYAFALAQEGQANLHLLHVLPASEGEPDGFVRKAETELAESLLDDMVPEGADRWCEVQAVVKRGEPAHEIVNVARAMGADLIVLGTRRPPRIALYTGWAVAYQVLGMAPCPVLTVREAEVQSQTQAA